MNLQHHFLIAMPALQDPIFRRSVVYICEYNEDGAMGIIINKPLENLQVEGILEKLKITLKRAPEIRLDKPVMLGGPLAEDRGFILHTPPGFSSSIRISDNTVITTSRDVLETLVPPNSLRKCWLRWAIPPGRKASWSRRSWIMPGLPPLRIRISCLKRLSPIAGARRLN
jgi:putative AlgH/UPF0301 family transcriptional regulator